MEKCKNCGELYKDEITVCNRCYSTNFEDCNPTDSIERIYRKERLKTIRKYVIIVLYFGILFFCFFKNPSLPFDDIILSIIGGIIGLLAIFYTEPLCQLSLCLRVDSDKIVPSDLYMLNMRISGIIISVLNIFLQLLYLTL